MNIAICDDNYQIVESVKKYISDFLAKKDLSYEIYTFNSGESLLNSNVQFDIAFIDIEMKGINGLYTSQELIAQNENIVILIITAYQHYLDDVMDLSLYRFITKPIEKEKLIRCFNSAIKKHLMTSRPLKIRSDNDTILINSSDIIYIGIDNGKVHIYTYDQEIKSNKSFEYWQSVLDSALFIRTHQSYTVNMHYIIRYNSNAVLLKCKDKKFEVVISKRRLGQFKKAFDTFIGGTKC